jgi:hypothetical protein
MLAFWKCAHPLENPLSLLPTATRRRTKCGTPLAAITFLTKAALRLGTSGLPRFQRGKTFRVENVNFSLAAQNLLGLLGSLSRGNTSAVERIGAAEARNLAAQRSRLASMSEERSFWLIDNKLAVESIPWRQRSHTTSRSRAARFANPRT